MTQTQTTISVILKDSSKKEIPSGSTGLDLAKAISNSLAKKSIGLLLNNELKDLLTGLNNGDKVPGGDVSEQTTSVSMPSHAIFDTRNGRLSGN